jgi:hypothetical protein
VQFGHPSKSGFFVSVKNLTNKVSQLVPSLVVLFFSHPFKGTQQTLLKAIFKGEKDHLSTSRWLIQLPNFSQYTCP